MHNPAKHEQIYFVGNFLTDQQKEVQDILVEEDNGCGNTSVKQAWKPQHSYICHLKLERACNHC